MTHAWTESELALLVELYPHTPTRDVAAQFQRGISGVYGRANALGLKKSQAFIDSDKSGRLKKGHTHEGSVPHQFQRGQVPFNKGLRRPPGWSLGRMRETQFRKGFKTGKAAENWKPIGTVLADGEGYLRIKVRDAAHKETTGFGNTSVWPLLNRHIWEKAHGPIPTKHIVKFKDGNRSNCVIENLELMTMADNARKNSMWNNYPPELARLIQLNGALKRRIKRMNGKEQTK